MYFEYLFQSFITSNIIVIILILIILASGEDSKWDIINSISIFSFLFLLCLNIIFYFQYYMYNFITLGIMIGVIVSILQFHITLYLMNKLPEQTD